MLREIPLISDIRYHDFFLKLRFYNCINLWEGQRCYYFSNFSRKRLTGFFSLIRLALVSLAKLFKNIMAGPELARKPVIDII